MKEDVLSKYPKLTGREKVFYGFGDLSTSLVWTITVTWAMFFYTDIFGISAMAAGTLLLISRIYDAALDPFVGAMVDRTNTKYGRARPYLLWFALPYGVAGAFLFFTPNFSESGKLIYAYLIYFALVTVYTIINIPYNSMISLMTKDQKERSQLSRNRLLFAMAAYLVVSFVPKMASLLGSGATELEIQRSGFFRVALVLGALAVVGWLLTFFNTKEHIYQADERKKSNHPLKKQMAALMKNPPWLVAILMTLFSSIRNGLVSAMVAYYCKYYLNNEALSTFVLLSTIVGIMIGLVLGAVIISRIGIRKGILAASVVSLAASVLILISGQNTVLLLIAVTIFGMAQGVPSVSVYTMFGDAVEYGEWKTGVRVEGMTFASYTFMQQVASGISGFLIGVLLTMVGYNSELAVQSAEAVKGISTLFVVTPIVLTLVVIAVVYFYPLSKERYREIILELEDRKKQEVEK